MSNTSCEKCAFSNPVESSEKNCIFDIPSKINRNIKTINNYNFIENYKCLYGFSKNQIENNEDLKNVDIKDLVIEKAKLKYYFIIDLRNTDSLYIDQVIRDINNLEIKPNYLSLIVGSNDADLVHNCIKNNLSCRKWKMHVFLETTSLNDCINLILDTNIIESNAWCVLFAEAAFLKTKDININKIINNLQEIFIIKQDNFFGVKYEDNNLNLLCLNSRVYKSLSSTVSRDILASIGTTKEVILTAYDNQ
jgi:hypothetical protein